MRAILLGDDESARALAAALEPAGLTIVRATGPCATAGGAERSDKIDPSDLAGAGERSAAIAAAEAMARAGSTLVVIAWEWLGDQAAAACKALAAATGAPLVALRRERTTAALMAPLAAGVDDVVVLPDDAPRLVARALAAARATERSARAPDVLLQHPLPTWVFDEQTLAILAVNDAAARTYGWSREELLRMTIRDLRPVSERLRLERQVQSGQASPPGTHWVHQRKDGSRFDVDVTSAPVTWAGRRARIAAARDVTTDLRVAEAHRRLGADFRAFVERLPDGVFTYRVEPAAPAGVIRYANPALLALLGYGSLADLDGRAPLELFAPADHEAERARMRLVLESSPATLPRGVRLKARDGALRWCEVRSFRVGDERDLAVMVIARPLERPEGAAGEADALRLAEERFSKVFQHNPACISITRSSDDTFVDVNDRFCIVTGFRRDEILGRTGLDLGLWPVPAQRQELARAIRAGQPVRDVEVRLRRKSGEPLEIVMSLEAFSVGGQECVFAIGHDVTERKQLDEELRQAQKMEAIGRLAGGVAHDFNNLLTAIRGYSQLLVNELPADSATRAAAEHVHRASLRASSLTEQLLAFTRRQPHRPRVVALNDVVLSMGALIRRIIGEDIRLELQLGSELGLVRVDPAQIEQVLLNLAVNSRDAMASGGTLTVETANSDEGQVRLTVRDSGVGMSPEVRSHIFEPFFTTKEVGKGTGLGLAIVFGVIEQNGGAITVESEPGRGSQFHIWLPTVDAPVDAEPTAPVSLGAPAPVPLRETILLVEDDEDVRDFVQFVLRQSGYQVVTAEDGPRAMELARDHAGEIDLLLSDVIMPNMNGVSLVAALQPLRPHMKVLHMSGYPGHTMRVELAAGVAFLQKPFSSDALTAMVRAVLDS